LRSQAHSERETERDRERQRERDRERDRERERDTNTQQTIGKEAQEVERGRLVNVGHEEIG
jgi:hypothetical protein